MPWDGLGRAYALSDKGHGLAVLVEDAVGVVRLAVGVETAQLTRRPRGAGPAGNKYFCELSQNPFLG